ncbi:cation-translocating P-type ATPase [Coprococcus comes]|uniref:cation-translocating P-type ATPase n=1 Tax=Coprococcus comes TaxID=410072 RepID=UPI0018977A9B|nr:cation-translocating P-type ATPase [Coprococcus comes]MDC0784512.1 cation-translocating P-type ATPase [Coprococcus comes]MDC0787863.1 cation-translocating P-type ATPase [Coprococcus comes]MDC0791268.1 cation-translocating P-type ATPase [Coprococcus comes]MDC0794627.1 cation-translocating P-type ATPase [Coprococcus comes]
MKFGKKEKETQEEEVVRGEIQRVVPDYRVGLNPEQIRIREENGWTNDEVAPPGLTTKEIVHNNIFTYFNLIFLILAILLCLVGSFRNLTFLPVIICNTLIGIIQEIRSKKVLDRLTMLNAPHAEVIRGGVSLNLEADQLVVDDIVVFRAGNQICADAVVEAGEVQVNESLLTGESDEITKKRGDRLMSGSFVVSGSCHARLDKVGADSYISQLTLEAKAMQQGEQSEMIRSLDKLVKMVGIALIPIGIILFVQSYFYNHDSFRQSIISMVAAVIGMIPEGLYLLASVALAVSAMRLASKKVLLHDMKSIETLARVNVLCVDKTGTITEDSMCVSEVVKAKAYDEEKMPDLNRMIGDFVKGMDADNSTMHAMQEHFTEHSDKVPEKVIPFSSTVKYSGVIFKDQAYVLGAPEFVLREDYTKYQGRIEQYTSRGFRVLVFGSYDGEPDGKSLTGTVTPLGYVLLLNKVREEAPATFKYFADQGVAIKVISGDNPITVSETAKQAGIEGAENYVDAGTLKTEEDIALAVSKYTVFGRVIPEQKRQFVQALKKQGMTVAMTGDGVNDVLALKDADCSVAMASGSDAAVQASQVVLLESDFSRMPEVVLEGRRVVNNIQRSASLFLVKNIFSFLLAIFSAVFMITYPLEPSQVSLISMYTIGIPAFFLALQPNRDIIKGHFLTNVFLKALPAGLTDVFAVGALVVFGQTFGVASKDISTAATMLLAIVGFMILYRICQPMNALRMIVWIGCVIGLLGCSIFLPQLFAITGMSRKCIMLFVIFSIATEPVLRYLTKLIEWLRKQYIKFIKNPIKEFKGKAAD